MKGSKTLPNGVTIFWEPNGVGGRSYISDEIGGGVLVWDTALVNRESLSAAMEIERELTDLLPLMDCQNCFHRQEHWRDGGHCYMFREKPEGDRCGQFKKISAR